MPADTLCSLFQANAAGGGDTPALLMPGHPGLTWREYAAAVRRLAGGFRGLGIHPGDHVALLMGPRPEFHVVDTAVLHVGAVPFSIQPGEAVSKAVAYLATARARVLVTESRHLAEASAIASGADGAVRVVSVDGEPGPDAMGLADLEGLAPSDDDHEARWRAVDPEDVATLIFTSGTTGAPKAVQLSHRAIVTAERGTFELAPSAGPVEVLSYLPLNHIAERFMSHYATLTFGGTVHSVPDPDRLYDEILRVRPTRFFGVPRVYEKLVDRLQEALDADPGLAEQRSVVLQAVREEQRSGSGASLEREPVRAALTALAGLRESVGLERAEYLGVATAPSAYAMLEYLLSVGLRVSDIWGMSEVIMCTLNPPAQIRLGTVGRFLPGVEGRLAEDGEILVRGPHEFNGYLDAPKLTDQVRDAEGWVHTGDLGEIEDGYLSIRGRKKEMLITATGKNVAPAAIEGAVKSASPLIDHVLAVADGRRYVTALVALDPDRLAAFAGRHGFAGDFAALAGSAAVQVEVARAVGAANETLSRAERVRSFVIAPRPWQPGGDELTATSKLRRAEINTRYAEEIDALYAGPAPDGEAHTGALRGA